MPRRRPERGGRSLSRNPAGKGSQQGSASSRRLPARPPAGKRLCPAHGRTPCRLHRRPGGQGRAHRAYRLSLLRAAPGRRAPGILRSRVEKGLAGRKKAAVRGIRPARLVALSDRALRTAGVVGGAYRPVARSPHRLGAENRLAKRVAPQLAGGRPP